MTTKSAFQDLSHFRPQRSNTTIYREQVSFYSLDNFQMFAGTIYDAKLPWELNWQK